MFKTKGVIPPMVTPFKENGELDIDSLRKLVNFLKGEVDGLFITGSYGSGALMNIDERKKVVEVTAEVCNGAIPIIVMVGTTNNRESMILAKHAEAVGVDAVAAVGPYYYVHNEDSLIRFYADLIGSIKMPVYLYNNPKFQGYQISIDTIKKIKSIGLAGIKDATFDILTHANYVRLLKDENFDIALGTEALWLEARVLGTEAFIPGLANAFPEINVQMFQEGMQNDFTACRQTQFKVNKLREVMYLARSTQLAVYAMLEIRGIIKAYPRAPFIPATEKEKTSIKEALKQMNML